jgi:hypothetical protein
MLNFIRGEKGSGQLLAVKPIKSVAACEVFPNVPYWVIQKTEVQPKCWGAYKFRFNGAWYYAHTLTEAKEMISAAFELAISN